MEKNVLKKLEFNFKTNIDRIVGFFSPKTHIGEGFFVHFEMLYSKEQEDKVAVIKVAFGSSERPEHTYIVIEESCAYYFPNEVYSTNANKKAHKIIIDWLTNG